MSQENSMMNTLDWERDNERQFMLRQNAYANDTNSTPEPYAEYEGYIFSQSDFEEIRLLKNGQRLCRHFNGGGWVPADQSLTDRSKAYVDPDTYVSPTAAVLDTARVYTSQVLGYSRIQNNAKVLQSTLDDQAVISGHAIVCSSKLRGRSSIADEARVSTTCMYDDSYIGDHSKVSGYSDTMINLKDNAKVSRYAKLHGIIHMSDHAHVTDNASLHGHGSGMNISGSVRIGAKTYRAYCEEDYAGYTQLFETDQHNANSETTTPGACC